jgi:superfamily II DNA or RNA helicase
VKTLNLPFPLRDYQFNSLMFSLNWKRNIVISATGSGKSYVIHGYIRYVLNQIKKDSKICIVVPSISLVNQMYNDFISYGCKLPMLKIMSGTEKNSEARIYISTYQSLNTIEDKKYFDKFECVVWDEIHMASNLDSKCLVDIMKKFGNDK